jgi:hypothetical protein
MTLDYTLKGKRIKLVSTDDPFTRLKVNDCGEIRFVYKNNNFTSIQVDWDDGSGLSLTEGKDEYQLLEEEEEKE